MAADIFQDRNDVWTLVPFLEHMEENLGFKYPGVTADAGYEGEEAYCFLDENHQTYYIKPQTYERWKKRSFKKDISKRESMGYESEVTVYECEDCSNCPQKEKCTKAKGNKRLYVSGKFIEKRQKYYENIISERGILYRLNRSIQVMED